MKNLDKQPPSDGKPWYKRWKSWGIIVGALIVINIFAPDQPEKAAPVAETKQVMAEKPAKSAEEIAKEVAEREATRKAEAEALEAEYKKLLAEDEARKAVEDRKAVIDTSVFKYAKNIEVTDAIEINDHVTLIITMNSETDPGMATQHVVNQTYDFIQQVAVKGAKTIGINVKQGANKIAQYTVYTDKFVPNDNIPMSDLVMDASEIEFMSDEVKEFGKVMDSW